MIKRLRTKIIFIFYFKNPWTSDIYHKKYSENNVPGIGKFHLFDVTLRYTDVNRFTVAVNVMWIIPLVTLIPLILNNNLLPLIFIIPVPSTRRDNGTGKTKDGQSKVFRHINDNFKRNDNGQRNGIGKDNDNDNGNDNGNIEWNGNGD